MDGKEWSMMLRKNMMKYVVDHFDPDGYNDFSGDPNNFFDAALFIKKCFYEEKCRYDRRLISHYDLFVEWCSGLPSVLDTCYYYNRSAVTDLATVFEMDELELMRQQKWSYDNYDCERKAERWLTQLLYATLERALEWKE